MSVQGLERGRFRSRPPLAESKAANRIIDERAKARKDREERRRKRELERRTKLERLNRQRRKDGLPPVEDLGEPSEPESEGSDDDAYVARSPSPLPEIPAQPSGGPGESSSAAPAAVEGRGAGIAPLPDAGPAGEVPALSSEQARGSVVEQRPAAEGPSSTAPREPTVARVATASRAARAPASSRKRKLLMVR